LKKLLIFVLKTGSKTIWQKKNTPYFMKNKSKFNKNTNKTRNKIRNPILFFLVQSKFYTFKSPILLHKKKNPILYKINSHILGTKLTCFPIITQR
jgi:hypothetical protein